MSAEIKTLHEPFIGYLRSQGLLYRRSRTDRATTEAKGEPDFLVMENNRVLPIEFKDKGCGLSKDQVFRHAEYAKAGCRVFVVRELSAAIELVEAWRQQREYLPKPGENLLRILGTYWRETARGFEKVRNA